MDHLKQYKDVFCRVLNVSEDALNTNFTFKTIPQWDSVAHLSLITELEDEFDVLFESEDILHYGSYLNGIEILKKYGVEF
nr:acyl carrier protein [Clostridia bacterium]